jgi:outer membrane translocation and assembly module TamA
MRQLKEFTGIVFTDVGAAPISAGANFGYGIGISVSTPIGAVRIDFATGAGRTQTWLSLGQPF